MARLLGLLLCMGMLLTVQPVMATGAPDVPLGLTDFGRSEANLRVQSTSPEFTTISLDQPPVVVSEQMIDFDTYNSFAVPGEPWQWNEGCPAVPQVTRFYRIPNTGSVDLIVTEEEYDLIEGINALPVQDEMGSFGQLARNPGVYTRDAWYPAQVAEVSSPAVMRDFRVVTVTLHPVQVNPVTHQARIYRRLSANLVANDRPGENELLNAGRPSGAWAEIYRSQIANLDESALDEMTTTPGTYLILTKSTSNARQWADSLFIWKTRKGFKVVINTTAGSSASTMITAIRNLYAASAGTDSPLEHVCLVGDPNWGGSNGSGDGVAYDVGNYDHSFACATATDNVEDISVGRLCGETLTHMATINAKIMQYEREPWMQDTLWYHKGFFYAGVSHSVASSYPLMQWASQMFRAYTGVTNNTVLYHTGAVDASTVITQINGGVAFFLWRGGYISEMSNTLAGQTSPNHRLPITLTITCGTGDFEQTSDVSESWLTAGTPTDPKGGICGIGTATAGTHPPQNYTLAGGLAYNIANLGVEHIGTCLVGAKLWLHLAFGFNSTNAINFSRWCNLMGDPGLSIWTDVPKVMRVSHPTVLNVGARQVAVRVTRASDSVAVEGALVVLWKRGTDSTWVKGLTDADGRITLPVRVNQTGDMMLTVTKRNHKPYLFTIPCSAVDQMCAVSTYTLDDDNAGGTSGNGDGVVNPGEIIDLNTYLKNFGNSTSATVVSAQLASGSPRITVLQANATYPDIAPGDSALGSAPFRVQIAPDMQNRETALLLFTINTTAGQTQSAMQLSCVTGAIEYRSYQLVEGAFNPGTTRTLRVTLRNKGSVAMSGVTGRLVSLSPYVQVSDANGTYGNMAVNADVSNSTDGFTVGASTLTFRGHQASMLLITTATGGHLDSAAFILPVGTALSTDPTGPDSYGYCAYDNTDVSYTDTSYEMCPTYQYINISGVGTNLNLSDTGEQLTVSPVWSTARRLPFPFKFYGQEYDTVTVCANGWIAFGNQSWNPVFRNYPIPAMVAPEAMIAPYWDDLRTSNAGQGVWMHYNADSHWVVFQWKASAGSLYGTSLDFEVILYDTVFYPTFDGNGLILMQYNTVSMNLPSGDGGSDAPGSSIGIQAPRGLVGLAYAYQSSYAPGAASVVNSRAILFTTNSRQLFGDIAGTVTDAEDGRPVAGVTVSVNGANNDDDTDSAGYYFIENVLIGTYSVSASKPRFNTAKVESVLVELDSTEIVNFSLYHPEIALSTEQVIASVTDQPLDTSFSIRNAGNGPLDYAISIYYAGDENPNPWDSISAIPVSALTGDLQIMGCEFVGNEWWVTGGGGPGGQNLFYRFSRGGEFLGSIPQPSTSAVGWFDLACDSQYVYGSEDHTLVGVDHQGVPQVSIPTPVNPARAVAYDPASDHFWVTDYTQDFYEIDRQGNIVQQIPNSGTGELSVTGLAWYANDTNGFKLYIFSQNGVGTLTRVTRLHPVSQAQEFVVDLPGRTGDRSGGCTITPAWNSMLVVFGGIIQNSGGDRLQIHEMEFNTTWIDVSPAVSDVPGNSSTDVLLHFDPITLQPDTYRVHLHIRSEVLDTLIILPVELTVISTGVPQPLPNGVPAVFALHQNYPNPFNPTTTIRYDLPRDGQARLTVYNLLGRQVAELVNERQSAGRYEVRFEAADLPSGMYFYRLESGGFVQSAKMILMK
ncbi:MAG: C25 family cysteine peptidase [bacterium]|nr:C25 family cysteine peptidase [bacterium]